MCAMYRYYIRQPTAVTLNSTSNKPFQAGSSYNSNFTVLFHYCQYNFIYRKSSKIIILLEWLIAEMWWNWPTFLHETVFCLVFCTCVCVFLFFWVWQRHCSVRDPLLQHKFLLTEDTRPRDNPTRVGASEARILLRLVCDYHLYR